MVRANHPAGHFTKLTHAVVIMDPMDKNFDLEAFLTKVAADNS